MTSIGTFAFYNCEQLRSVKLGDNISEIGGDAFYYKVNGRREFKFYVNNGTLALLTLLTSDDYVNRYSYNQPYRDCIFENGTDVQLTSIAKGTPSSIRNTFHPSGGLQFVSQSWKLTSKDTGQQYTSEDGIFTGLEPNGTYLLDYTLVLQDASGREHTYSRTSEEVKTIAPVLTTLQPKVISLGNVIVAAESNLDDEETNVGFEWRRTDWTNDFASNTGAAYLYEGMMEGYIRNLYYMEKILWKYRPYYESNSGNRYYGDWVGIDPTNTNYFEPTVHTYAAIHVQGNSAEVKGYAMRGTDNVTSQGFMYWAGGTPSASRMRASGVPADAMTVLASGNVMTATLEDLEYETTYWYVAFVTTSEGETFYGEPQTFSTSVDPDGVEGVRASEEAVEVARYDIQGRRIAGPQKGINIVRYSDGSSRKVLVK